MFRSVQRLIPSKRSPQSTQKTVDKYMIEKYTRDELVQILGVELGGNVQIEVTMPETITVTCYHPTWTTAIRLKQTQLTQALKKYQPNDTLFIIHIRNA